MSGMREEVDPFVQERIPYTNDFLYRPSQFRLTRYPIPELRLDPGDGKRLLDIGCNWGRWSIAAARKGYAVSGIDPSPQAILAARRVAKQLALDIDYRSGSGEIIPFAERSFDVVFSYSVRMSIFFRDNIVRSCMRPRRSVVSRATRRFWCMRRTACT